MGQLIELPNKKVVDYVSIHGLVERDGWRVTHHYVDGETKDFDFKFLDDPEDLIRHLRSLTTDRLDKGK
jgi:hypothetical protein